MTHAIHHRPSDVLAAGLDEIRAAPSDRGTVEMIVRRPADGAREVIEEGVLDLDEGLVGDNWRTRGSRHTPDGSALRDVQITLMNVRAVALVAGSRERWPLAGDQFFVDLDLSPANLPAGTRLAIGDAVVEVTARPHLGCHLFRDRFGADALQFVNSPEGRDLNLRGVNAKVIEPGHVQCGDEVEVMR